MTSHGNATHPMIFRADSLQTGTGGGSHATKMVALERAPSFNRELHRRAALRANTLRCRDKSAWEFVCWGCVVPTCASYGTVQNSTQSNRGSSSLLTHLLFGSEKRWRVISFYGDPPGEKRETGNCCRIDLGE